MSAFAMWLLRVSTKACAVCRASVLVIVLTGKAAMGMSTVPGKVWMVGAAEAMVDDE